LLAVLGSRSVGVLPLLALFICLASLRRYIIRDHENLAFWHFRHVAMIVVGDDGVCNLEHATVWG
jgi:hypothetical protein